MGRSMTTTDEALSAVELWKAQLAYVSGTILAWGALLLQLWPVLARLQTGVHVLALGRDDPAAAPATSFYLLALLVAVGLGMLAFGVTHIVARGFWFTGFLIHNHPAGGAAAPSERVARNTYIVLHLFWGTAVAFFVVVPLFALSAVLSAQLAARFGWPVGLSRAAAVIVVFVAPLAAGYFIYRRRWAGSWPRIRSLAQRVGRGNLAMAFLSLPLLWLGVLEFSYVAQVRLERLVFSRAADPTIVVAVELGGAVSDPAPARVLLTRASGEPQPLQLRPGARGVHVATVETRTLRPGDYAIDMTYPHGALSPAFPFFQNRIRRNVGFVVID